MEGYDVGRVCLNGHKVNSMAWSQPDSNERFCSKCGEPTISECQECHAPIRGYYHVPGVIGFFEWELPHHCHECGKPYPWTTKKAEALDEVIDELDELSAEERSRLKSSIPDIIAETPKSETAVLRFKKAAGKAGQASGKVLLNVLTNVAAEAVKKSMGL